MTENQLSPFLCRPQIPNRILSFVSPAYPGGVRPAFILSAREAGLEG